MATPSVTPKPERRNRIIRQSVYQEENLNQPKLQQTKQQQQSPHKPDSIEKHTTISQLVLSNNQQQQNPNINYINTTQSATYHQICLPSDSIIGNNNYEFGGEGGGWEGTQQPPNLNETFIENKGNTTKRFPLIYRVQMLKGFEVLCKRLLFHLVKASAGSPKCFIALPFALVGLSLLLCSFSSSWPSSFFPFYDIFHFGTDQQECVKTFFMSTNCQFGQKSFLFDTIRDYNNFPSENPLFDAPQHSPHNEFTILLTTTKTNIKGGRGSILTSNGTLIQAYTQLFNQIQDSTIQHHTQVYKWWDLCRQCHLDQALDNWIKGSLPQEGNSTEISNFSSMEERTRKNFLPDIFGDVELNSFQHVHSLIMRIKLKRHLKPLLVDTFERHLRRIIVNFSRQNSLASSQEEEKPLGIHFWSAQQLAAEIENSLRQTHVKILICWVALCGILAIVQIRSSTYESRPMVGVQQALTLLLASVCAYAVHLASSERFNSLLFALPFTLASIGSLTFAGVDSAFERYSGIAMHPTEKMAFLFIWDGCALVLLPLLWLILLCFFCSLLVQSIFLLQSLLSLAAGFSSLLLFSLTFLLVCWLGTARRMAAGLKWFQICRTGDQSFNEKQFFDYDAYTCARLHEKLADLRPCFGRRFGHLVCGQNFRMLSFGLFCILCIGAIIGGITTNKNNNSIVKLEASHFLLPKSQSQLFIENFHQSFPKYEDFIEINFDGPMDYEERKEHIFALLNWPIEIGLANRAVSWLIEFEKFKKTVAYRIDEESSVSLLTHVFLRDERYNKFLADLHVSQGQIHKSRMYLKLTSKGRQQSKFLIRSLLEKAKRAALPISLHVPFSFSITHDIQVIPKMFTSILWLCTLSAILSALQPSLAICLFVSNLFLCASVNTCFYLFNIPLNVVTLGILAVFGLPLNSACILHFSHHFFNSGPLQQNNYLRIQYAFQCSLWPICLATFIGPLTFCFELIFGTYPPIVFNVFQILTICSTLIFIQIFVFLPSLLPMFSDLFHDMFTIASQLCDENANAEMTVDPMSENVYFVRRQQPICPTSSFNRWQAAMGYHQTFNVGGAPTNLSIPPAYKPPPIEYYPFKPQQNNNFVLHSRQTSRFSQQDQNINSPRINSSCGGRSIHTDPKERSAPPPPIYSPPNMRKDNIMINGCCCSKTDSGHNSFSESLESHVDLRIRHLPAQQQKQPNNIINRIVVDNNNKTNNLRTNNFQIKYPSKFVAEEEQIYEEPDSPLPESKNNKNNSEINICAGAVARAKTRLTH
uniref:Uncharacterized protein n=1 Tax=Meloidogyne enterolobii TaxID=390850 RepID=A0A6V7W3U2_MELEN|nr:unnamed protein product [Meloidogyne enterolobii]